jgi:hypothetical protein
MEPLESLQWALAERSVFGRQRSESSLEYAYLIALIALVKGFATTAKTFAAG